MHKYFLFLHLEEYERSMMPCGFLPLRSFLEHGKRGGGAGRIAKTLATKGNRGGYLRSRVSDTVFHLYP
jgi:hypothetical protein